MSNLTKIIRLGAELTDTDGQSNIPKLMGAFRKFDEEPKIDKKN